MSKYLIIIGAVLFTVMGTIIFIQSYKLDGALSKLGQYEQQIATMEQAIKEQEEIIDDLALQSEIINRNLQNLNTEVQRIEEENIERIRTTEEILDELATLESAEAAKRLSDNLNSILNKMEGVSR